MIFENYKYIEILGIFNGWFGEISNQQSNIRITNGNRNTVIGKLGLQHSPHDGRYTYASLADNTNMKFKNYYGTFCFR